MYIQMYCLCCCYCTLLGWTEHRLCPASVAPNSKRILWLEGRAHLLVRNMYACLYAWPTAADGVLVLHLILLHSILLALRGCDRLAPLKSLVAPFSLHHTL